MFSHALQHGLLRSEYCITLQSVPYRPPQLRCVIFPSTYLPHLPSIPSDSYWASVCLATLPDIPSLICDFCPSDQRFAIRLPSDSTSRWTPLPLAVSFPLSGHFTDLHRLDYVHAGQTKYLNPWQQDSNGKPNSMILFHIIFCQLLSIFIIVLLMTSVLTNLNLNK